MLRVTIELIPYGVEAMAKTIAELCIANTDTKPDNTAGYHAAGYHIRTDNKIEEYAIELKSFPRDDGVLALLREILSAPREELADNEEIYEQLIQRTRLNTTEEE